MKSDGKHLDRTKQVYLSGETSDSDIQSGLGEAQCTKQNKLHVQDRRGIYFRLDLQDY